MSHFAESPTLFADIDDVQAVAPIPSGRVPSYMADHRKRLRERFMAGGAGAVPNAMRWHL